MTDNLEITSDKAYKKELKSDDKISKLAKTYEMLRIEIMTKIREVKSDLERQESVASDYQVRIEDLERNQEASERYQEIKSRINSLTDRKRRLEQQSTENYNLRLLDDEWILCAFPGILREFQVKAAALARTKRKLNKEYITQQARLKGKQEAYEELTILSNGATALPWDLPDLQTMQEMIDEHICKVCGSPAPEGSDAYNFMVRKLEDYKRHLEAQKKENEKKIEDKPLFPNNYINEIRNLGISLGGDESVRVFGYANEIRENIEFVAARKIDLQKVIEQLEDAEEERKRIIIQADGVSDVHTILDRICRAFKSAREKNLRNFLDKLSEHANSYLERLNPADFHGTVNIIERANGQAKISLVSSNGDHIYDPNGALKTTMYMSILFAISDLTTLTREEDYPLIFDAPTSSFGEIKEDEFYNIIAGIKKQCIIVTKDLLEKDTLTGDCRINQGKLENLKCSVYRIEKEKPFDPLDLSTVCIKISKIKD